MDLMRGIYHTNAFASGVKVTLAPRVLGAMRPQIFAARPQRVLRVASSSDAGTGPDNSLQEASGVPRPDVALSLGMPASVLFPEDWDSMSESDQKSWVRRRRISLKNKGKRAWNEGLKHSPGGDTARCAMLPRSCATLTPPLLRCADTIEKIRSATRRAMENPEVREKLARGKGKQVHSGETRLPAVLACWRSPGATSSLAPLALQRRRGGRSASGSRRWRRRSGMSTASSSSPRESVRMRWRSCCGRGRCEPRRSPVRRP